MTANAAAAPGILATYAALIYGALHGLVVGILVGITIERASRIWSDGIAARFERWLGHRRQPSECPHPHERRIVGGCGAATYLACRDCGLSELPLAHPDRMPLVSGAGAAR